MFRRNQFIIPMSGFLSDLKNIKDQAFASGSMGSGFMIEYTGDKVVAPVTGEVIAVFPTGHAFGLKDTKGREFMIHIGIDTFDLDESLFDVQVKQGDRIKQGEPLVYVDANDLKAAGFDCSSAIICTSGEEVKLLKEDLKVEVGQKKMIKII